MHFKEKFHCWAKCFKYLSLIFYLSHFFCLLKFYMQLVAYANSAAPPVGFRC